MKRVLQKGNQMKTNRNMCRLTGALLAVLLVMTACGDGGATGGTGAGAQQSGIAGDAAGADANTADGAGGSDNQPDADNAGTDGAGQGGSQSGGTGTTGGTGSTDNKPATDGAGQNGGAGSGNTGSAGAGTAGYSTAVPVVTNGTTIAIGEYEWGGRVAVKGDRRYDALESRIRTINQSLPQEGGSDTTEGDGTQSEPHTTVYVTRADETALSLLVTGDATDDAKNTTAGLRSYVIHPETGKDMRLTDLVTDTEQFTKALRAAVKDTLPGLDFPGGNASDQTVMEQAQSCWTADYDGVTVYFQNQDSNTDTQNISCVTLRFDEHADCFDARFFAIPERYMTRMVPGRTYGAANNNTPCTVEYEAAQGTGQNGGHAVRLSNGDTAYEETYSRTWPVCYLVHTDGADLLLLEPPQIDDSRAMMLFWPEQKNLADGGTWLRYGLADHGACDPARLRLADDTFSSELSLLKDNGITGYAHYALHADGTLVKEEDFWYLEGAERTAARQADTVGYRIYDSETLVSKQMTRGMKLTPYRTDGETWFEFASDGDVFRFDMEGSGTDVKFDGIHTFNSLFES